MFLPCHSKANVTNSAALLWPVASYSIPAAAASIRAVSIPAAQGEPVAEPSCSPHCSLEEGDREWEGTLHLPGHAACDMTHFLPGRSHFLLLSAPHSMRFKASGSSHFLEAHPLAARPVIQKLMGDVFYPNMTLPLKLSPFRGLVFQKLNLCSNDSPHPLPPGNMVFFQYSFNLLCYGEYQVSARKV